MQLFLSIFFTVFGLIAGRYLFRPEPKVVREECIEAPAPTCPEQPSQKTTSSAQLEQVLNTCLSGISNLQVQISKQQDETSSCLDRVRSLNEDVEYWKRYCTTDNQ